MLVLLMLSPPMVFSTPSLPLCPANSGTGNCSFVSNLLFCDAYTYDVLNFSSSLKLLDNQTLTLLNGSFYYFNMTQPVGDYLVQFCDNSTQQYLVVEAEKVEYTTSIAILYLGLLTLFGAWFYVIRENIPSKDKLAGVLVKGASWLFFLSVPWLLLLGVGLSSQMALDAGASQGVLNLLDTTYSVLFYISWFSLTITVFVSVIMLFNWVFSIPNQMKRLGK